ncbi:MAG TPA: DUF2092 domain-containing protein [Gemmatimonadaceae bacterium]|jgi:hypothetical protein
MSRSRQITVTVIGVIAAIAVIATLLKVVPSRVQPVVASAPNHTEISHGEVTADTTPVLDQDALAQLELMGNYLRTLKDFKLAADVVTEDVRTDGQKVQIIRSVELVARRPDRLFAEVKNDRQRRLFFYDGKNFTLYAPRPEFYATVAAPSTIEKLADDLEDKYDIELPLVDLFRWGTPESDVKAITSATDLGPSAINDVTCEQYAFRQEGLDWQLWIQRGENPLPCRIVITTLTDEARPQHTATYTWNLAPSFDDNTFVFRAPPLAKAIPIAEVPVVASSSNTARQ